ncbi:glyoxalase [Streptomyces sp. Z26]|nr:glyoxalase [Streptomyces sp. Z26]
MNTPANETHGTTPADTAPTAPTADTTAARPPMVWPCLQAHDASALIDFLTGTVGFLRTAVHADGDRVAHAQLDWPEGGGVMLGSYRKDAAWSQPPGTFGAYVVTADVDALHARLRAAGVEMVREIADQDYGNREFSIKDPEGNMWSFGVYAGEPQPSIR